MRLREATGFLLGRNQRSDAPEQLGDFTTTRDVIPITLLAIGIGIFSAFVASGMMGRMNHQAFKKSCLRYISHTGTKHTPTIASEYSSEAKPGGPR